MTPAGRQRWDLRETAGAAQGEAIPTPDPRSRPVNPPQPAHAPMLKALEDVARALGLQVQVRWLSTASPDLGGGMLHGHAHRACRGPDMIFGGTQLVTNPPPGGLGSAESAAAQWRGESICGQWGVHDVRTERARRVAALAPTTWIAFSKAPSRLTCPWNSPRNSSW